MTAARVPQKSKGTYITAAKVRKALAALYPNGRRLRSDGRPYDTGLIRPYRPKPADFREVYVRMGWDGIEEHFATNTRVIRRWIEEEGRPGLVAARAAFVEKQRAERREGRRRETSEQVRMGTDSPRRSDLHPGTVAAIFAMVENGMAQAEVARQLQLDDSTVSRTLSEERTRMGVTAVKPGRATG